MGGSEMVPVKPERGFLLAAMLGSLGVISLLGFVGCILALVDLQSIPSMTQQELLFYGVWFGLSAICIYGMLDWKRWGIYGLGVIMVIVSGINILRGTATFRDAVAGVLLTVAFVAVLRPAWHHFD